MVSNRNRYVSESTSDDETADMEYLPNNQAKPPRKPTRTPKCFSKNALMARENRLKKKMYITTLENQVAALKSDNKRLSQMVDSQVKTIEDMKKEVKYLKSILANSEGIGKLLKAINSSTGMDVSSSITNQVKSQCRLRNTSPIAEKIVPHVNTAKVDSPRNVQGGFDITRHPWEESGLMKPYESYPTPDSSESSILYDSPEFEELNNEGLLLDINLPIEMDNDNLLDMIDEKALESPIIPIEPSSYHNLQIKSETNIKDEDDVGVCLHVAKNKVSLEFCPSCSDKALQSWKLK